MARKWKREETAPNGQAKRPKMEKKKRSFSCVCGARFDTKGKRNSHQHEGCKELRARKVEQHAQSVEDTLRSLTQPGSECCECGRLYAVDDILYGGKYMVARIYDGTVLCSDCSEADPYYEHKEEPLLYTSEIESYLQIRRSMAPFPWLKERREKLFKELQQELHKPERVKKWLDSGHDLESYLN